jgi:NADH-quinone oxidoreductase subunit J
MDHPTFFFWLLAIITGVCAIAVVVTQNIVRAAAYLLFTLAGVGGIFFLLGADFVGATQLIVYIGGILVLVVFGVMLTAQGPFVNMKTGAAEWAISFGVGVLLYSVLALTTVSAVWPGADKDMKTINSDSSLGTVELGLGFLGVGVGPEHARESNVPPLRGNARTSYLLPFEIVSVHLLVVLIGAAYLARAKRRRGATA